jgi:hypothetical protein
MRIVAVEESKDGEELDVQLAPSGGEDAPTALSARKAKPVKKSKPKSMLDRFVKMNADRAGMGHIPTRDLRRASVMFDTTWKMARAAAQSTKHRRASVVLGVSQPRKTPASELADRMQEGVEKYERQQAAGLALKLAQEQQQAERDADAAKEKTLADLVLDDVDEEDVRQDMDAASKVKIDRQLKVLNHQLHQAVERGDYAATQRLLRNAAVSVDYPFTWADPKKTLLNIAAARGDEGLVKMLLLRGADTCLGDEFNDRPLHSAAAGGHLGTVCQLLDAGANKYHLNTNAETPLHLACHGGHDATVLEFLCHNMSKGGNLNIQYVDTKGNTGLHVVAQVTECPM